MNPIFPEYDAPLVVAGISASSLQDQPLLLQDTLQICYLFHLGTQC